MSLYPHPSPPISSPVPPRHLPHRSLPPVFTPPHGISLQLAVTLRDGFELRAGVALRVQPAKFEMRGEVSAAQTECILRLHPPETKRTEAIAGEEPSEMSAQKKFVGLTRQPSWRGEGRWSYWKEETRSRRSLPQQRYSRLVMYKAAERPTGRPATGLGSTPYPRGSPPPRAAGAGGQELRRGQGGGAGEDSATQPAPPFSTTKPGSDATTPCSNASTPVLKANATFSSATTPCL